MPKVDVTVDRCVFLRLPQPSSKNGLYFLCGSWLRQVTAQRIMPSECLRREESFTDYPKSNIEVETRYTVSHDHFTLMQMETSIWPSGKDQRIWQTIPSFVGQW